MMSSRDLLLDLFDHMESADAAVWAAVLRHEAARDDAPIRHYLLHASAVQRGFLDAWTNQPLTFRINFDDTSLVAELAAVRDYYPRGRAFVAGADAASLVSPMVVPWVQWVEQQIGRQPDQTTLGETIMQVVSHTTHHRAQASARLRALGGEPPLVDYIAWLWRGRPQPEWPGAPAAV